MQIHPGVDSKLVDDCLIRACQRYIYEKPVSVGGMETFQRQRIRMEIQDWYRRQCRPFGSFSSDSNCESSDDATNYVPSSDSEYGGPYEYGRSSSCIHQDALVDVEQCEEREDMSATLAWR
eukprot:8870122-Prorocentrum_lima.AAC.1